MTRRLQPLQPRVLLHRAPDRRFENHFNEIRLGRKPPLQDTIIKCESEPNLNADLTPSELCEVRRRLANAPLTLRAAELCSRGPAN
jgi:hypothetical protein